MLSEPKEECEFLSGPQVEHLEERKELPDVDSGTVSLLTLLLFLFVAVLLYQATSRVFAVSTKQEDIRDLLRVYA